jgi:hypothetical protein
MEKIRRWKWEDPSSLDGFPKSNMSIVNTKERFEIVRAAFLRQLGRRLTVLQHREEIRRHEVPVDGLSLEAQFGRVLKLIRPGARQPMNASYLSENFNEQERRIIHALLEQMIERKPWRGIQWSPIWRKVFESKDGSVGQ